MSFTCTWYIAAVHRSIKSIVCIHVIHLKENLLTNLSAIAVDSAYTPQWLVVMRINYKPYCTNTQN